MSQISYVRCPRCELNYMPKGEKVCSVCQKEMKSKGEASLDDLDLELDICPICKVNYIQPNQTMCSSCLKERENNKDDIDLDENWQQYIDDDEDEISSEEDEVGEMASVGDIEEVFLDEDTEIPGFEDDKEDLDFSEDDDFDDEDDFEDDDDYEEDNDDDDDFTPKKRKKSKKDEDDDF